MIGDDVGCFTPFNETNITSAFVFTFADQSVPTILLKISDGQGCDRNSANSLFRSTACMTCQSLNMNLHSIATGGTNCQLSGTTTVPIEGKFWIS